MNNGQQIIRTIQEKERGMLSFFEAEKDIPFSIKRVYYISGTPAETIRGKHAHKTLKQFLFCPFGEILVFLDDGIREWEVLLDAPNQGLFVTEEIWHEMHWKSDGAILCVVASDYYDETDYIRDYQDFLKYVKEKKDGNCR